MTKSQNRSRQLQLRLLADVSGVASDLTVSAKETHNAEISSKVATALPATETDMSVYRQISGNYFRSLRKTLAS
jgi:hypothetical protein